MVSAEGEIDLANREALGVALAPTAADPLPVTMWLYVPDCDAAYKRAMDAGAKSVMPPPE